MSDPHSCSECNGNFVFGAENDPFCHKRKECGPALDTARREIPTWLLLQPKPLGNPPAEGTGNPVIRKGRSVRFPDFGCLAPKRGVPGGGADP